MNVTTPENEVRTMLGDLMMQIAMLRADNANMKAALEQLKPTETSKPNGAHPPEDRPSV